MSVIRVGSTNTYAEGWDAIFGRVAKRAGSSAAGKKKSSTTAKQKAKATKPKARRGK